MTRACVLLSIVFASFLGGCVQSLHPYYKEDQLTYDGTLVGTWKPEESEESIVITGDADAKSYTAVYTDKEKKTGKFDVHLAKVNDRLLLDIAPAEPKREDESDMYQVHLLPVHSFMLVERKDADTLVLRQMDSDWLKAYLEKNPTAVAHETLDKDRILLTAPSEKVQAFVLEHVDTPDAYEDPSTLKRAAKAGE